MKHPICFIALAITVSASPLQARTEIYYNKQGVVNEGRADSPDYEGFKKIHLTLDEGSYDTDEDDRRTLFRAYSGDEGARLGSPFDEGDDEAAQLTNTYGDDEDKSKGAKRDEDEETQEAPAQETGGDKGDDGTGVKNQINTETAFLDSENGGDGLIEGEKVRRETERKNDKKGHRWQFWDIDWSNLPSWNTKRGDAKALYGRVDPGADFEGQFDDEDGSKYAENDDILDNDAAASEKGEEEDGVETFPVSKSSLDVPELAHNYVAKEKEPQSVARSFPVSLVRLMH